MNKYGNRKATLNGKTFDSLHEARRYQELRMLQRAGKITDLETQVPFELIPAQRIGNRVAERQVRYVADFVYTDAETGEKVVEDAKGMRTRDYIIKRKLMLWRYRIRVREV